MSHDLFKWLLSGALTATLSAIVALLTFILVGFRSDLHDVRLRLDSLTDEVHRNYIELSAAIAALSTKLETLGTKLDAMQCRRWW